MKIYQNFIKTFKQLDKIIAILNDISSNIHKEEYTLGNGSIGKIDGSSNIGVQNNFNGVYSIKPIELSESDNKIQVFGYSYSDWDNILEYFFVSIIMSFCFLLFWSWYMDAYNIVNITNIMKLTVIILIIFVGLSLWDKYRKRLHLEIRTHSIRIGTIDSKKIFREDKYYKEIEFKEIRSIYKKKNLFGYTFYLYHINEIFPYIRFNTESIHVANTINELIAYKIMEDSSSEKKE